VYTGHDGQIVRERGRGEQRVDDRQRLGPLLGAEPTPTFCNRPVDRDDPRAEASRQLVDEPVRQTLATVAILDALDALADLAEREHAQEE